MTSSPLGEYITRRSPLHRLRPGAKLLGLFLFGALMVAFRSVPVGIVALVIGVGTRAEIWDKKAWEQYLADNEQGYSDIADDVLPSVEWG